MKTLILYASKKGTTKDCATTLQKALKADIIDLNTNNELNLNKYDLIVIGTPLYMGRPISVVKKACTTYLDILLQKKIAFFICGLGKPEEMIQSFKKTVPSTLIDKAITINHFGGEARTDNANFIERFVLKKALEGSNTTPKINKKEIDKFIKILGDIK